MPFYDFKCNKCQKTSELLCSSTAKPKCCKSAMKKLVSAPKGYILKGAGFYKPTLSHMKDPKTSSFEKC